MDKSGTLRLDGSMPNDHERGHVDWKLLLGLVILFFLAGSTIFQHRRIARLERDLSLVRMEVQNVQSKSKSRRLGFFEQYAPMDARLMGQNTQRISRLKIPSPLRKTDVQPARDQSPEDLLIAALTGDSTALDRLDSLASRLLEQSSSGDALNSGLAQLRAAFRNVSEEAGNGNEDALGLLWRATRKSYLAGIATDALGHAAALGNGMALELLLNPEQYGILNSSAVGALIEPAQAGVEEAIAALISVAIDPTKTPLWYLAATGLQPAAEAGNELAIQTFAALATSNDPNVSSFARMVLENAAANGFIAANTPTE
jgi:hypothetical protein